MNNISTFGIISSFEQCLMGGELLCPNVSLLNDSKTLMFTPQNNYAQYLYIEPLESNANVKFVSFSIYANTIEEAILSPRNILKYSINRTDWFDLPEEGVTINNQRIYFKCENPITDADFDTYEQGIGTFIVDKFYNVGGNVMSLIYGDDFIGKTDLTGYDYVFSHLFNGAVNTALPNYEYGLCIDASNLVLPAMTLTTNCYCSMFGMQNGLCNPPSILPAETLAEECYAYMFAYCFSLTTAPELPATVLTPYCYSYMFMECSSLVKAPELPATTLTNSCYINMFSDCVALTTTPELPATKLAECCYQGMFYGCTSLTTVSELPATTLARCCYQNMFGYCTSLVTAPELPATTLTEECYRSMFYNCSKLSNITMLATDISANNCLSNWVKGVAPTGTFYKHPSMTSLPIGASGIPSDWTIEYV